MATVHLARAHGPGGFERLVALKAMHPHIASEPDFVDMFLDEARLAARIHHPNVVGTSDVQQDESGLFLVMDYIEGAALQIILRDLWLRGQNVRLDVALRIFLDALAGLHAAHELTDSDGQPFHLVHRDVSPQNILVGTDGVARLTDFGVARARSRLATTQGGQLKGKLTYMAPEQVRGEPVDRRTDLYAAGVVLWEMLAGQRLHRGDNDGAIVQCILEGVSRSPRDASPEVPEPVSDACMRALCFEPDDRFATAADFAEAIEAAADEAGVHIATARAVSVFVRELNLHTRPSDLRAARANAPTLPAPLLCEQPTVRERVTSVDNEGIAPPSSSRRSGVVSVFPSDRERLASSRMSFLVGAGILAVATAAGWLVSSIGSEPPELVPPLVATGGVPLEPPSVVHVPPSHSLPVAEEAPKSTPAPPAVSRERRADTSSKQSMTPTRAAPSPTSFRPREL
jgi:serine/threonine-protein kinase